MTVTEPVMHQHELGFVYAEGSASTLTVGDQMTTIEPGKGAAVAMVPHTALEPLWKSGLPCRELRRRRALRASLLPQHWKASQGAP